MKNNEIEKPLITLGEYISDFAEVGDKFLSGEYREKDEEAVYVVVSIEKDGIVVSSDGGKTLLFWNNLRHIIRILGKKWSPKDLDV